MNYNNLGSKSIIPVKYIPFVIVTLITFVLGGLVLLDTIVKHS